MFFAKGKKAGKLKIGLDIGTDTVKAVAIEHKQDARQLVDFSVQAAREDKVGAVKKAIANLGTSSKNVNISVCGPSTITRIIDMPRMSDKELKASAEFEAEKYIPYKIDEVLIDCVRIKHPEKNTQEGKIRVLLVAAKKDLINKRLELLSSAELTPMIIDLDSFAVTNAFLNASTEIADSVCALINLGAKTTNLNILSAKTLLLGRDIDMAGDNVALSIVEKLGVEAGQAESLKTNPGERKQEIEPIIKSVLYDLFNEIKLSFDFFENQYGKSVDKIFVSGGSSELPSVSNIVKDFLGSEASTWDPLSNIKISSGIDSSKLEGAKPLLAVAVGLALR